VVTDPLKAACGACTVKGVSGWVVGDRLRSSECFGVVVKVGRKWVTVQWTQDGTGATWQKQHLPVWLDGYAFERSSTGKVQRT